jgi:hypothetical protein
MNTRAPTLIWSARAGRAGCSQSSTILGRRATTGNWPVNTVGAAIIRSRRNAADPAVSMCASGSSSMKRLGMVLCHLPYICRLAAWLTTARRRARVRPT